MKRTSQVAVSSLFVTKRGRFVRPLFTFGTRNTLNNYSKGQPESGGRPDGGCDQLPSEF